MPPASAAAARATVALLGACAALVAGCTGAATAPSPPRAPDLGLIELCPPKGPPPGTITLAEQRARNEKESAQRQLDYQRELAEHRALVAKARNDAEAGCAALTGSLLAGSKPEPTLLGPAALVVGRLDEREADLLTCAALAAGSDAACALSARQSSYCRIRRALVESVGGVGGASERLVQALVELCRGKSDARSCEALRRSVRAGDAARCPAGATAAAALCAAFAARNPARCPKGDSEELKGCPAAAAWTAALAKDGLAGLERSARPLDQALGAAAQHRDGACAPLATAYRTACVVAATPMPPAEPLAPRTSPDADTPPPGTSP